MKDMTPLERWNVWLTQAQRFARRENYIDALGRARLAHEAVTEALAETEDETQQRRYARFKARVERRVAAIEKDFAEWNAKIAARRQAMIAAAEEEMARPLPLGPNERY